MKEENGNIKNFWANNQENNMEVEDNYDTQTNDFDGFKEEIDESLTHLKMNNCLDFFQSMLGSNCAINTQELEIRKKVLLCYARYIINEFCPIANH